MQPSSMRHKRQLSNKGFHETPTIIPALRVGNCETSFCSAVPRVLVLQEKRKETFSGIHLAEHDVIHIHFVGAGDKQVSATFVGVYTRPQRPPRASITRAPALQKLTYYQLVPLPTFQNKRRLSVKHRRRWHGSSAEVDPCPQWWRVTCCPFLG